MGSMTEASRATRGQLNSLVRPLLTDMYQISMLYSYWREGKHNDPAVFDLYFRKNPFKGEYTIFAGLSDCLKFIERFIITEDDINYLRSIPTFKKNKEGFWDYLLGLTTKSIKLLALKEGSVCFPHLPLLRVEGPLGIVNLIETTLLNLTNYPTLITTCAARFRMAAGANCKLFEFGLRRAQGPDGALSASRYAYIGGFNATSNLLAGREFGIPVCGTMSHAFILKSTENTEPPKEEHGNRQLLNLVSNKELDFYSHCQTIERDFCNKIVSGRRSQFEDDNVRKQSEFRAFIEAAVNLPENFLALVDTYDIIRSGLINYCIVAIALIEFGYKPIGVRIDSGDLAYLSLYARDLFNEVARVFNLPQFNVMEIVVSNDINERVILALNNQNHAITCLGIGTHLVTCQKQPALGCVYKLVEIKGTPCMKLSSTSEKTTIPCKKMAYRLFGKDDKALLDLMMIDGEPEPEAGRPILCRHPFEAEKRCYVTPARVESLLHLWWDGKLIQETPTIDGVRAHCPESLSYLRQDIKRFVNPTPYKLSVSERLFNMLSQLKLELTSIGELS